MIRFIDLRSQDVGRKFAFFDTVSDRFREFDAEQAWDCVADFKAAFNESASADEIERFIRLMPIWALK